MSQSFNPVVEGGGSQLAAAKDEQDALVDKLKSGEYQEVIASATKGMEAQEAAKQLCLQADGGVVKDDPHKHFYGKAVAPEAKKETYEDDLKKLRQERMRQMKMEENWKAQGHGEMMEMTNELEFVQAIKPHERAIVLLDDGGAVGSDVLRALTRLAKKHIEAQFCRLPADKAVFLTHMVKLDGLPALFIVEEGRVTQQLSPSVLFEYSSASSPLFIKHLARALHKRNCLLNAEAGDSSAEEDEAEDSYARRRGHVKAGSEAGSGGYSCEGWQFPK